MRRAVATFKHADIVRAVRAARAAGLDVTRTEIAPDGRIVLVHTKADFAVEPADAALAGRRTKRNAHSA